MNELANELAEVRKILDGPFSFDAIAEALYRLGSVERQLRWEA